MAAGDDEPVVREGCAAINLAHLTKHLQACGLFPMVTDVRRITFSALEFSMMLSSVRDLAPTATTLSAGRRGIAPTQSERHGKCHIGHRMAADQLRIWENQPWPVPVSHIMQLKTNGEQLKKLPERSVAPHGFLCLDTYTQQREQEKEAQAALEASANIYNVR